MIRQRDELYNMNIHSINISNSPATIQIKQLNTGIQRVDLNRTKPHRLSLRNEYCYGSREAKNMI
jgi:hypothetical protein